MRLLFGLVVALTIATLLVGTFKGDNSIALLFQQREGIAVLRQRVQNLERENEKRALEISRIEGSANYAQRILRDKYHLTGEGERIVFFAD